MPLTQLTRHIMAGIYKNKEDVKLHTGLGKIQVDVIKPIEIEDIRQWVESFQKFVQTSSHYILYYISISSS